MLNGTGYLINLMNIASEYLLIYLQLCHIIDYNSQQQQNNKNADQSTEIC